MFKRKIKITIREIRALMYQEHEKYVVLKKVERNNTIAAKQLKSEIKVIRHAIEDKFKILEIEAAKPTFLQLLKQKWARLIFNPLKIQPVKL